MRFDFVEERQLSQPSYRNRRVRRWAASLWRDAIFGRRASISPAPAKPKPEAWTDDQVTAAWLGHSTVLVNFFGMMVITDPVLFSRIGVRLPLWFTAGPKRLTAPALSVTELPPIDLVLLSHAHFDHTDRRTLSHIGRRNPGAKVVTATCTRDLLRRTALREITELKWKQQISIETHAGAMAITAIPVRHWGARVQHDRYRGYNGYLIERNARRIVFAGDTAFTESFGELRRYGPIDLAIFGIGAYQPWIESHCSPEQAIRMANDAGARFIMPVHHQTFRLSFEPFDEPIHRFENGLQDQPERIALRKIGETFILPN